jgi:hypothetical protein
MIHWPVDEVENSRAGPFVVFAVVGPETWESGERAQLGGDVMSNSVCPPTEILTWLAGRKVTVEIWLVAASKWAEAISSHRWFSLASHGRD